MNKEQTLQKIKVIVVPTPKWLQRYMLRNLKEEANSRISKERAERAQQILEELKLENHKADGVASAGIPVQAVKTQVSAMNHQSITDRSKNNSRYGIVGKVVQCVQEYLGRLLKS